MDTSEIEFTAAAPDVDCDTHTRPPPHLPLPPSQSCDTPHSPPVSRPSTSTHHDERDKPNSLSAAARLKLSVTALIASRGDDSSADHFTALPGDAQEALHTSHVTKGLSAAGMAETAERRHGILEEGKWGTEGLLGSKPATRMSFAANAKNRLSAQLGLSGGGGGGGGASNSGEDGGQTCEYVAMTTPCESPVGNGIRGGEGQQVGTRERDTRQFASSSGDDSFSRSPSLKAGLVTRLGSALQSWTTGRVPGEISRPWGGGAAREGRPGPLGAKYTQQAAGYYSPFEPSPHQQLRNKLPVDSAFTVAAAMRGVTVDGVSSGQTSPGAACPSTSATIAQGLLPGDDNGPAGAGRQEVEAHEGGEEDSDVRETPESENEVKNSEPVGEAVAIVAPSSPSTAVGVVAVCDEIGAESAASSRTAASGTAATSSSEVSPGGGSVVGDAAETRPKKVGLWELKAERSRLEQALAEAEADLDVEKARAREAANRLEDAVARLESLRRGGGGDGGGVGDGGVLIAV